VRAWPREHCMVLAGAPFHSASTTASGRRGVLPLTVITYPAPQRQHLEQVGGGVYRASPG
jgi:hypothetical protein